MANSYKNDLSIFKRSRLRFNQLKEDVIKYLKDVYKDTGETFSNASPFFQIVQVTLHLGRMILYYIQNSINELNITRAFHPRSVKGISTLTGHNPSRGTGARGTVKLICKQGSGYDGTTVIVPNYTSIKNLNNGLSYILNMPSDKLYIVVGSSESTIEIPVVQGKIQYSQFTGSGMALQSVNVPNKDIADIDNFFVNVYVNGEKWRTVQSMLDLTYAEKACVIKTGASGGIDVFFGTELQGKVPPEGSTILVEYLLTNAESGNIFAVNQSTDDWSFEGSGTDTVGNTVSLNDIFAIEATHDMLFGASEEVVGITRLIAPHTSRSYVLANATNYEYFLRKLNMFSIIDTIAGFNTYEDSTAQTKYNIAMNNYLTAQNNYKEQVIQTGADSYLAKDKYEEFKKCEDELDKAETNLKDSKIDDNNVYLFLVPDITKRMNSTDNYFTCNPSVFKLSNNEKTGILDLIEESGQRIMTIENTILDPKMPQFAVNIFIQMWEGYSFDAIKEEIVSSVSDYMISNTRRDRIPVSDFVSMIEAIDGVDSVSVFFDADKNNSVYYGDGNYGIDEFGDIILSRSLTDPLGISVEVNDLLPVFRSINAVSFMSPAGVEYFDDINNLSSVINVTLRGKTTKRNQVKNNIS